MKIQTGSAMRVFIWMLFFISAVSTNLALAVDQQITRELDRELDPPAEVDSFIEWMEMVERASDQKGIFTAVGLIYGLGGAAQAMMESSWPNDCDGQSEGFCPRDWWRKEFLWLELKDPRIFGYGRHDRINLHEMAVRIWCEARGENGYFFKGNDVYICEVEGVPAGILIQRPSTSGFQYWAIEPKWSSGVTADQVATVFGQFGYVTSVELARREVEAAERRARAEDEYRRQAPERERQRLAQEEAKRVAEAERQRQLEEQARIIRQIGRRICKTVRDHSFRSQVRYVGFTEGVSPDNGRVQIRVAAASVVGAPDLSPGGFQPHIIWDDPMNWELCE